MEFFSATGLTRPIRLSEKTRKFAYDSLHFVYGQDTKKVPAVSLDAIENFDSLSPLARYDTAIRTIASKAPLRICAGERISGAATLGMAISHLVPAVYQGTSICPSISHLTVDFETVLKKGVNHIRRTAEISLETYRGTEREAFLHSCLSCLDSFELWHRRYLEELKKYPEYAENLKNLQRVPFEPAQNFSEAVQSIWFTFAFIRLCGNWPGIGRLDALLGPYLEHDLASGLLTLDEAREILAHFFIKGCEWICGGDYGSGDAQHYQNIVIGGVDENGDELTGEVTYLILDILEELGISDFPTTVRLNKKSPEQLLSRTAEVIRYGGGILAVYNEDLILDALVKDGYPLREARKFANDGCWEVQIPGRTYFIYSPFDALAVLEKQTLASYDGSAFFADFEELYKKFSADIAQSVKNIRLWREQAFIDTGVSGTEPKWHTAMPCTIVSLFEGGCVETGRSYLEGGPVYNLHSPHIGGLADAVNSLYAIKKLVYDEKKLTLDELFTVLKNNWEGEEPLRQYVLHHYAYYGNDCDAADSIAVRLLGDFADACAAQNGTCGYRFPAGVSTFGRQIEWAPTRLAAPHGRKSGEVLAANASPTPGTDKEGATAVIRSYCKADHSRLVSGSALDLRLVPKTVSGADGLLGLMNLIRGFLLEGGFFFQPDVIGAEVLRDAQKNPDNYQTLSVRVSGWNARFITLNREWQNMIIGQTDAAGKTE